MVICDRCEKPGAFRVTRVVAEMSGDSPVVLWEASRNNGDLCSRCFDMLDGHVRGFLNDKEARRAP